MAKKPPKPKSLQKFRLRPLNRWVGDALRFAGMSQAKLSREMVAKRFPSFDRSTVNKIVLGPRDISGEEMFAIAEITGFPAPNVSVLEVPLLSWVPAGDLARDDVAQDALRNIAVAGLPPGNWIALKVEGDSMDRISPPDSIIFVNRLDKSLVANACYVIEDEERGSTYKRFRPGPPGPMRFEPVSNNKDLSPIFPDQEPFVVGRVRRTVLDL